MNFKLIKKVLFSYTSPSDLPPEEKKIAKVILVGVFPAFCILMILGIFIMDPSSFRNTSKKDIISIVSIIYSIYGISRLMAIGVDSKDKLEEEKKAMQKQGAKDFFLYTIIPIVAVWLFNTFVLKK
jgi:hypothetical protein